MNNFITLTKVFFLAGFNVNRKKKNQSSAFKMLGLSLFLFALASLFISFMLINQLEEKGMPIVFSLSLIVFVAAMLNFVMLMYQMQSIIFNAKDFEFLESLPVTKTQIVGAKLTATYLVNLFEDIALIVPAVIFYFIKGGDILPGIITIGAAFFVSFIPILIASLIAVVSALVSARSKHSNIINIVVSLLFFAVFFGGYLYFVYAGLDKMMGIIDNIFFLKWLNNSLLGAEYIGFLYFALFNLGIAILFVILIAILYSPVNSWLKNGGVHVDYDKVKRNNKTDLNVNRVLLKKEWELVYRRPTFLINSILGTLFFMITGLIFLFIPNLFVQGEVPEGTQDTIAIVFVIIIPCMGIMMNSIASCTGSTVSFEGRNGFELLLTYPIRLKDVLINKLKIGIILEASLNLIVSTVILIAMLIKGFYEPYMIIALYLYPQLAGFTHTVVSLLTGIKWAKLDFDNDSQVFKNSAAANMPMLIVFLPCLLLVALHVTLCVIGLDMPVMSYVALGSVTLIYAIAIFVSLYIFNKKGEKMLLALTSK